ncbi:MAG: nitroreductase family protein [Actinomycetota bacterium]|nr:nitroreductase family protein [Actinomycetota bacterium]MDH5223682.1 nitroreductase family protein [Actinomycetota bacterium]
MEFIDVVHGRRMVRRFDQRPVPREKMDRILDVGRRGPSAGFAQGVDFLVLDRPDDIAAFWQITRHPESGWDLDDIAAGPTVLVLPIPDPAHYLARYSEPDKIAFGLDDPERWPVKFWEIDAGMAAMLMLLAAVDEGLGAWFFGIDHGEHDLLIRFDVPEGLRPIGIMGFGFRADDERPSGSGSKRLRRPFGEQVHRGGW